MTRTALHASAASTSSTIVLLAASAFLSGAALRICDGLIPRLALDFQLTPGVAGQAIITFSIAYGLMQLVFGPLGDRYGKARMVCVALLGCAAASLASALASSFAALLAMRIGWGLAAAGIVPLAMAWIGDAVPYEERQATLAKLLLGTLSGMMAGQLAGGLFADSPWGWRGAFLTLTAGFAVVGAMLLARLPRMASPSTPNAARVSFAAQLASVLRAPWARVVLAAVATEGIFLLGPLAYLPAYLHLRFGLTMSAAASLIALYAAGGLLYAVTARRIVSRFGERRMVFHGGWMMGAAYLALLLSPLAWTAAPAALLLGFGTYLLHNTLQTNATQMAPAARGTAVSLFAFCLFVGQAIGVTLTGSVFDRFGMPPVLLASTLVLPLLGWGFARAVSRRAQWQQA